jgi:hypothetical protein
MKSPIPDAASPSAPESTGKPFRESETPKQPVSDTRNFFIQGLIYLRKPLSTSFLGRSVAQPGRALAWGARGRRFESCRSDHLFSLLINNLCNPCKLFFICQNRQVAEKWQIWDQTIKLEGLLNHSVMRRFTLQ